MILSGIIHTKSESLQGWLRDVNLWNNSSFSLCIAPSVCYIVTILGERKKSKMGVSANWYIAVKH